MSQIMFATERLQQAAAMTGGPSEDRAFWETGLVLAVLGLAGTIASGVLGLGAIE